MTVVLGVLLAATAPRFTQTARRLRAEQAAFDLVQVMRYARERAVADQRVTEVVWDREARRAQLVQRLDGDRTTLQDRFARSRTLPDGMSAVFLREEIPVGSVPFFPDGTSEPTRIRLTREPLTYTVTVDATTGQIVLSQGPTAD